MYIVALGAVADAVGKMGGVQDVLSSLRNFPRNADIAGSCCVALWGLSLQGEQASMTCALNAYACVVTQAVGDREEGYTCAPTFLCPHYVEVQ